MLKKSQNHEEEIDLTSIPASLRRMLQPPTRPQKKGGAGLRSPFFGGAVTEGHPPMENLQLLAHLDTGDVLTMVPDPQTVRDDAIAAARLMIDETPSIRFIEIWADIRGPFDTRRIRIYSETQWR